MNNELKPTWNYILNDLALYSLLIKVAYSEDVTKQDKVDLEHQIKLLQAKVNQLETNIDEAIEYIKHSWRLKFDQVYDTSKYLNGWEVEELLSILETGEE